MVRIANLNSVYMDITVHLLVWEPVAKIPFARPLDAALAKRTIRQTQSSNTQERRDGRKNMQDIDLLFVPEDMFMSAGGWPRPWGRKVTDF